MTEVTVPPGGGSCNERYSEGQARIALDTLLGLRRKAEECPEAAEGHALVAAMSAGLFVRGILSWAAEALGLLYDADEARRPPVEEARWIVARTLDLGLPVMQPSARAALADALRALNAGQVDPLVAPKVGRRGKGPYDRALAELRMLMWVRWQHGLGRRVAEAKAELSEAAGRLTPGAFDKWEKELSKVYGKEYVQRKLQSAECMGRFDAARKAGVPEAEAMGLAKGADGVDFRDWAFLYTPRSLDAVVALRRSGTGKRRILKSGDKSQS